MKLRITKGLAASVALGIALLLGGLAFVGWRVRRDLDRISTIDDVTVISGQLVPLYQGNTSPTEAEIDAEIAGLIKGSVIGSRRDQRPLDAYGTPFRLRHTVQGKLHRLTATSAGPDRRFDTPDDISREATWETLTPAKR
jgi:hypothetical protein